MQFIFVNNNIKKKKNSSFNYSDTIIFHAGTSIKEGKLVTSGGRVLAVTGVASTLRNAVDKAYECVKSISFDKMYFRKDIAHRYRNLD